MYDRAPLPPLAAVRAFEAAARHGNFTRAGEELGMTQAAVSYQIKVLEDRTGAPLFRRNARGVSLTSDGERLAARAGEALEILRDAFAEATPATRPPSTSALATGLPGQICTAPDIISDCPTHWLN